MDQYIGKLLDNRYEILEVIGVGGMAVVYRAYCHRLNRFVAVKVLKNELAADAEFRRRFHDEAQAVAMLSHPNIVSVYDVSRGSDLDYIVMELIDGITLKQYMKKKGGPLGWREALHFITQIMRALSHAHGRGIIHRDIKPQNIMVLRDGSVKVADFGIARVMSAAQKTLTQEALGSVHYISPEQAKGSHLDARADIYSAGVVLYEMLTGRLPFEGDSPVSVAIQHISSIPLSPRELNPDVPEALEAITMHAMAQKVEKRYVNAEEMLQDLEEFRKNPDVVFSYPRPDLPMQTDEPTQIIETTGGGFSGTGRQTGRRKPVVLGDERIPPPELWRENDHQEEPVHRRKAVLPIVIVSILFLVGVAGFLWVSFFSGFFKTEPTVEVPDLVGKTLSEVYADKDITAVFKVQQGDTTSNTQYPEGTILKQDPDSGTRQKQSDDHTIIVTVSGGKEYVTMIDVSNMTYSEALIALEKIGLEVATPDYQTSDEVEKGKVISFTPLEGTQVAAGETVNLTVSLGAAEKKVTVMSCVGQSLDDAKKMLTASNLKVGDVSKIPSDEAAGTVVYQSIPVGTEVDAGSSISLQVSLGPNQPSSTVKTKNIPVQLPTDQETVEVKITVGGEVKYDSQVNTSSASTIYPPVDGSGTQNVCVYINGQLVSQYDLDFDQ